MILQFGDFSLDEELYQLRRGNDVVKLEPKTFDVLAYLVRHRDRVVAKDELLEKLWPGEFVTESVLPSNVANLRRTLGDGRAEPRFIETVYGRGYRFKAAVVEIESGASAAPRQREERLFVGREPLLDTLGGLLEEAITGSGRLVLLVGEPGIGKTRTIDELAERARKRGARVLVGRCHEGEGAPAFWPWVQVLRAGLRDRPPDVIRAELAHTAADVAQLVPELRQALPDIPEPEGFEPAEARFRLFDAVTSYLFSASSSEPLVLVLDDLHWADKPSLLLLRFLARELRDASVLVIGAYRDVELRRGQPLAQVLGELTSEPHCRRIALHGIDRDAISRFMQQATGESPAEALVASVHERTGGNPYFVGEIVRLLGQEGASASAMLPEGVREAIGRRLDKLSEDCNRILSAASVLGREFPLAPLEPLTGIGTERILELLDEALSARILTEVPRSIGHYEFAHALVRETLYEELSALRRVELHRSAGEVLEQLHAGDLDPVLAEIAHHFFQAAPGGRGLRAADYSRRAAERAMRLLAFEEAAGHYERALEAVELSVPADDARRCELTLLLAQAWAGAGERDRARQTYARAADLARSVSDAESLGEAALGFGGPWEWGWGPDDALRRMLEEAIDGLGDEDGALRARLLARLSGTHPYMNSHATRGELSAQAMSMARRIGDRDAILESMEAISFKRALGLPRDGDVEERLMDARELFDHAAKARDPQRTGATMDPAWMAHNARLHAFVLRGDIAAADVELRALAHITEEQRQLYQRFALAGDRFGRAHGDARYEDARFQMRESMEIARRMNPTVRTFSRVMEFLLARDLGPAELGPRMQDVASTNRLIAVMRNDHPHVVTYTMSIAARVCLMLDRGSKAEELFAELATRGHVAPQSDLGAVTSLALQAEIAVALGDEAAAGRIFELLDPHADRNVLATAASGYIGWGTHFTGILAGLLGQSELAEARLQRAIDMNERMGARAQRARSQVELARVLLDRDREAARALIEPAAAEIEALGLLDFADQARELRERAA